MREARGMAAVNGVEKLVEDLVSRVARARHRLAPFSLRTPVLASQHLGTAEHRVWLKCDNLQRTGSFKIRGALNKILSLPVELRERGVIAASTGNHGLAVAEALRLVGGRGTVVVSAHAAAHKRQRLMDAGLRVIVEEGDTLAAELRARRIATDYGLPYISPYNDAEVVAGQGTVGSELKEQLPSFDAVFVPVGGGGLIAGIAAALKSGRPDVRVIGCWAENARAMYDSMRAGHAVEVEDRPTLSDATTGGLEAEALTIPLCRALVDDCVLVSEREIMDAMRSTALRDHLVIEGAAGVAVAGYRRYIEAHPEYAARQSVVVLCGGQVSAELLVQVLRGELSTAGDRDLHFSRDANVHPAV